MINLRELAKEFNVKVEDLLMRADGRVEWICKHGIGHTIKGQGVHGCDGCCSGLKRKTK